MANLILSAQSIDIYKGDGLHEYARTGALGVNQLYKAGAEGVIVGHSEVGDDIGVVQSKMKHLFSDGRLTNSTLLVGETWEEFEHSSQEEISILIGDKVKKILASLAEPLPNTFVVGYEPKWGSWGSGRDDQPPPSPDLISLCVVEIRKVLNQFNLSNVPVIYGGKSSPERTKEIFLDPNIEGLILGSACNSLEKTLDIVHEIEKKRNGKRKVLHANFKAYPLANSYEEYVNTLSKLDDNFTIYLSPSHTDLRILRSLIDTQ